MCESLSRDVLSSDYLAALGAFLAGIGSVLGAWRVIKRVKREERERCEERLREYREGLKEGLHMEERHEDS